MILHQIQVLALRSFRLVPTRATDAVQLRPASREIGAVGVMTASLVPGMLGPGAGKLSLSGFGGRAALRTGRGGQNRQAVNSNIIGGVKRYEGYVELHGGSCDPGVRERYRAA